ncbi:copper chaperone PCu(A)C [Kangiella sp. HZ709]|uniref:copper chaperone PCu(A)C n=1 Tax=Kangiella sp. HZ709 TaxID=2666328 RepID=UPI0012B085BD|nr:copper chaperone PCu(A)C [Kangiella sp. HZ709]MRX27515.1 copper chaperone PCu(A)C [Kangiella sp. HZ709]
MILNKLFKSSLSVTFLFLIVACEEPNTGVNDVRVYEHDGIQIINPWLRKMPEGVSNTAGFMQIKNETGKPLVLEDVSLDWARMGMIHESKVVDGMAKMIHQDALTISDTVDFAPGGLHIMVMGMDGPLDEKQTYNIHLHFSGREPLAVAFQVGEPR